MWANQGGWRGQGWGRPAASGGGGGGLQTATWTSLIGFSDAGGGTVSSTGSSFFINARTTQEIASGNGYIEGTVAGTGAISLCLDTGTYNNAAGEGDATVKYRVTAYAGVTPTLLIDNVYAGEGSMLSAGDVIRIEISGTSLLVKVNGSTVITATSQTFSYPYFGLVKAQNDLGGVGSYAMNACKVFS